MTQTTTDRVALIRRMYDCFGRGDMDTLRRDVLAPNIVWILPGRHPLGGTKHGVDEVLAFFQQLNRAGVQIDLTGLDEFGQDTVVEVHRGYSQRPVNGATLEANNCTHYQIVNGKIQHVQVYLSDQYGADNLFWAAFQLKPIPDRLAQ